MYSDTQGYFALPGNKFLDPRKVHAFGNGTTAADRFQGEFGADRTEEFPRDQVEFRHERHMCRNMAQYTQTQDDFFMGMRKQ